MKILDTNIEVAACPVCGTEAFLHTKLTIRGNSQFWPKCDNLQCGCTINAGKDREEEANADVNKFNHPIGAFPIEIEINL